MKNKIIIALCLAVIATSILEIVQFAAPKNYQALPPIHHVPFVATTTQPSERLNPPPPIGSQTGPLVTIRDILWRGDIDVYNMGAPGDSITFIGNLSNLAAIPLGGDQYGDGVWLSNGKYSANLYNSSTSFTLNGDDNDFMVTNVPRMVCPGAESVGCPPNLAIPIPFGNYSIYIKVADGNFKSGISSFAVVPKVSPPPRGGENYR